MFSVIRKPGMSTRILQSEFTLYIDFERNVESSYFERDPKSGLTIAHLY